MNPIGIRNLLRRGQACGRNVVFDYHRQHGLDIKIVRIFNTHGPGMLLSDGRVVSNSFLQALTGQPITILGEGDQTRSFCLVDDLVAGFVTLMDTDGRTTGPINLENPSEFSIRQLAELVINATGSNSKLVRKPIPSDGPTQRRPDISMAKEVLGWEPKVRLGRSAHYFEEVLREAGGVDRNRLTIRLRFGGIGIHGGLRLKRPHLLVIGNRVTRMALCDEINFCFQTLLKAWSADRSLCQSVEP